VKRPLVIAVSALALAAAGLFAALVPAGSAQEPPPTTTGSTTETTTTADTTTVTTTTTTPTTTTTAPKPKPKPKPMPKVLPHGVTIGGIHVGGLAPRAAYAVVRASFDAPLVLVVGTRRLEVKPASLGAVMTSPWVERWPERLAL